MEFKSHINKVDILIFDWNRSFLKYYFMNTHKKGTWVMEFGIDDFFRLEVDWG